MAAGNVAAAAAAAALTVAAAAAAIAAAVRGLSVTLDLHRGRGFVLGVEFP